MALYEEIREAVNEAANELNSNGKPEFKRTDLEQQIQNKRKDDWDRFSPSFQVYFSKMQANDDECIVESVPGSYLYRVSSQHSTALTTTITPVQNAGPPIQPEIPRQERECKLYQVLQSWLKSRGYKAAITASGRRGGIWGNPDITGLRIDELPLGHISFECCTIEAKLSSSDWRYWLFEAVSHKRFAQRAYFAFAIGTDSPSIEKIKDLEQMCQYAEKYRVGILVVFVSLSVYYQLTSSDVTSVVLDSDNTRIETIWPAFYEPVQTPALNEFMTKTLEIYNHNDFSNFGQN